MTSGNVSWMVIGLVGILALLLLICRYLGGWTWWTRACWLTSNREEKMILTKTGQYHPNGFMIPSDSTDLNISGGGSFRRTIFDYQLLRQGSTVSIPSQQSNSSNIPPQPLRPAPILPVSSTPQGGPPNPSKESQVLLEQQSSVDSVFIDSPPPVLSPPQMPRIPPPKPSTASASVSASTTTFTTSSTQSSNSSSGRTLPIFSMTNPFLPLLQASTQFFSQTLQGFQSFQNSSSGSSSQSQSQPTQQTVTSILSSQSDSSQNNNYGHNNSNNRSSTTSSSAPQSTTTKLSMGELLFSAPPATTTTTINNIVSSSSVSPPPSSLIQEEENSVVATTQVSSSSSSALSKPNDEFNQNSYSNLISDLESTKQESQVRSQIVSDSPMRRQFSNPFSPQSSFKSSSFDATVPVSVSVMSTNPISTPPISTLPSSERQENFKNYHHRNDITINDGPTINSSTSSSPPPHHHPIFNWTTPPDRPTSLIDHHQDEMRTRPKMDEGISSINELDQLLSRNSIFDQIRDFNELSMSRNEKDDEELIKQISNITNQPQLPSHVPLGHDDPLINLNKLDHVTTTKLEDMKNQNGNGNNVMVTTTDNPNLKGVNSVTCSSSISVGGHYSNSTQYRNARSFSLRQTSTDSIGSDGSDLISPDGSAISGTIQRAMSCDSVCSNSSVDLGELPLHLAGQLCIGLEYDSETADLLVTVIEAKEINPDVTAVRPEPNCLNVHRPDTYVRVYLLPDKTTNMQTRVYRKSLNPMYKEKFMFGLEVAEFPIRSLVFYMYATDKFSNTLIGEAELKLGELDILQLPQTTWLPLTDTGQRGGDLGEIMFSLSYLPTAERLTVVVVKGRNLKFPRENRSASQDVGDPFVKVYLLQRGKKVSKKKSSTKRGERNPIFNEAMIFGVPAHALQTIQLRITVADSAECESNRAYSIGHVIVGSTATGKPLSHWNQMLSSLRKPIAMWHSLRK